MAASCGLVTFYGKTGRAYPGYQAKKTMLKIAKRIMTVLLTVIVVLGVGVYGYTRQAIFGKSPAGQRLERIKASPNYSGGQFRNIHDTPQITEGYTMFGVMLEFLFAKRERLKPDGSIPSKKTDLLRLSKEKDVLVWFGHSSYFMQLDGKTFLVDPVFGERVSPIPVGSKAFEGSNRYTAEDMPEIDYLFITHDHYDHADYETLARLTRKVKKVVCGLGVGEHLEYWGYSPDAIIEHDWDETVTFGNGFVVHTATARHFSGRRFSRNNTLWMSYVLKTPSRTIYIGGDSGYDTHFAAIGNKYGPFDLVILENGQYDLKWKYIHMLPEEVLQAAKDLKAKQLFPVHSSKFIISNHPWDEPLARISELSKSSSIALMTPMIGEEVDLKEDHRQFSEWWADVK